MNLLNNKKKLREGLPTLQIRVIEKTVPINKSRKKKYKKKVNGVLKILKQKTQPTAGLH